MLDTSALMTLVNEENGIERVEELLQKGMHERASLFISFITLTEIFYTMWKRRGKEKAIEIVVRLKTLPITCVDSDEALCLLAGELNASYQLSVADSFVAATAIQKKAVLVHKDPDFEALKDRIEQLALPYKKSG